MTSTEKPYKTMGMAAHSIDKGYYQEVGETLEGMAPLYQKQMADFLEKHKDVSHWYMLVIRKKHPFKNNVLMQVWGAFPHRPSPSYLRGKFPLYDLDFYEVNNGDPVLQWALPGPEAWGDILKNSDSRDPQLVMWMKEFENGTLH